MESKSTTETELKDDSSSYRHEREKSIKGGSELEDGLSYSMVSDYISNSTFGAINEETQNFTLRENSLEPIRSLINTALRGRTQQSREFQESLNNILGNCEFAHLRSRSMGQTTDGEIVVKEDRAKYLIKILEKI